MKNKGFTLIELLAVIVILAIIALIATPIILGIINDARAQARKRSAELAYTGVEYAVTTYMYQHGGDTSGITLEEIQKNFKAENVSMDKTSGKITDNNSVELCTVTVTPNEKVTVNCGSYMTEKSIPLSA